MTTNQNMPIIQKIKLDGTDLKLMFKASANLLESNIEQINALNVFPVPDGDTGTNMSFTLQDSVSSMNETDSTSAAEVSRILSDTALKAAKGNSGVILSQFLQGFATGMDNCVEFGCDELTNCLLEAKNLCYKAVSNPVEGTMLTVISDISETALHLNSSSLTIVQFMEQICKSAINSVSMTPTLLPVLREAGVVDAGGYGIAMILEGIRRFLAGDELYSQYPIPEGVGTGNPNKSISEEFITSTEHDSYGYCTQLMIESDTLDQDLLRDKLKDLGNSEVVIGNNTETKIHIHTEDPGPIISLSASLGKLSQVRIENMDDQHAKLISDQNKGTHLRSEKPKEIEIIAVSVGNGLNELFIQLGVNNIVSGTNTMNPSVSQILDAVENTTSPDVIVLPNNSNIISSANQAAKLSKKNVHIVETKTIPEGISAMLQMNTQNSVADNLLIMTNAIDSVKTAEITTSIRDATINNIHVKTGQIIGLIEGELVTAGDTIIDALKSIVNHIHPREREIITLYYGNPLSSKEAITTYESIKTFYPDSDFELVEGGQPHYHLLISIE